MAGLDYGHLLPLATQKDLLAFVIIQMLETQPFEQKDLPDMDHMSVFRFRRYPWHQPLKSICPPTLSSASVLTFAIAFSSE